MFGIAEARGVDTGNEEMADIPGDDDTNKMPTYCEKRSRSTSDDAAPPSKRSKSSSKSKKVHRMPSETRKSRLPSPEVKVEKSPIRELRICISPIKKSPINHQSASNVDKNIFEVEKILDKRTKENETWYFIKWKGWSAAHNTWEPESNLSNCTSLISTFQTSRAQLLDRFKNEQSYFPAMEHLERYMEMRIKHKKAINLSNSDDEALYMNLRDFYSQPVPKNANKLKEKIKKQILTTMFWSLRRDQLESLRDWEQEINSITQGKPKIKIENSVDLESAPQDFFYIEDYLPGLGVIIPEEPPIGCDCTDCNSRAKCCYAQCEGSFPYTNSGKVRIRPGTPIYECNKRCKCGLDCKNRVVQRGSSVALCIFRTLNGRGWGVKTLNSIKKGTFITQYVGEVITSEEAEKRGKEYDAAGRTYLFDLDYNTIDEQLCPYTVDAAMYGNISHFINHSCDPNSAVYAVWIDCLDPNLPKLAIFATRDIAVNEEITFDYMRESPKAMEKRLNLTPKKSDGMENEGARHRLELPGDKKSILNNNSKTRCKCGAKCCRQYVF